MRSTTSGETGRRSTTMNARFTMNGITNGNPSTLADLDDDFATALKRKPVSTLPRPEIPNCRVTIRFPCGTHKTFRIHTQQVGVRAGRRFVSLLIGPDNSTDFEEFAELTTAAAGIVVYRRWRGKKPEEYGAILWSMLNGEAIEDHELLVSRNCLRCNRTLTTPEAVKRGIGDECWKKEGGK